MAAVAAATAAAGWPYVLDLGSVNGSTLNGERLPPRRYVRLAEGDVLVFGGGGGEYVLLHEGSTDASVGVGGAVG